MIHALQMVKTTRQAALGRPCKTLMCSCSWGSTLSWTTCSPNSMLNLCPMHMARHTGNLPRVASAHRTASREKQLLLVLQTCGHLPHRWQHCSSIQHTLSGSGSASSSSSDGKSTNSCSNPCRLGQPAVTVCSKQLPAQAAQTGSRRGHTHVSQQAVQVPHAIQRSRGCVDCEVKGLLLPLSKQQEHDAGVLPSALQVVLTGTSV